MRIEYEGQIVEVPDDFTEAEISNILSTIPAAPAAGGSGAAGVSSPAPAAPVIEPWDVRGSTGVPGGTHVTPPQPKPEPTITDTIMGGLDYADNTGAVFLDNARKGISAMASLPGLAVDAVNNAPRLANLLPGVDGVGPISQHPLGGSEQLNSIVDTSLQVPSMIGQAGYNAAASALGSNSRVQLNREPEDMFQRMVGRVGKEIGATAVPVGGAIGRAAQLGTQGVREAGPLARMFLEPAAVAPANLIGKEAKYAVGSGLGAGAANEAVGNPQEGNNFWSDLLGSLAGASVTAIGSKVGGAGKNFLAAASGKGQYMDEVAGQEVVDRIINNSTAMGEQYAKTGAVDTSPLAKQLRTPSTAEEVIPGYSANIGDRSNDPLLQTFAQNQDALAPGAANVRRVGNEQAVNSQMQSMAPNGDPAQFRAALEADRERRIAEALQEQELATAIFGDANQAITPTMRDASSRGSSLRSGLQDAYDSVRNAVSELWQPINEADVRVNAAPLRDRFQQIDESLPLNDRQRFRPSEANIPAQLAPNAAEAAPVNTGILDASGNPITRAPAPVDTTVPLNEITSARSGLSDDLRAQRAAGQRQNARVTQQYQNETDQFINEAVPPELRQQYEDARAARADQGNRFERPGTAIRETLKQREGGGYQLNDSAVTNRFVPTDSGKVDDMQALLREAGDDPRVRNAMADEVMSDVQANGLANRPEALQRYLGERNILLNEFPELRTRLENAGSARVGMDRATQTAEETQRNLTTPGRSAQASYLKFGDEATVDAVRNLTSGPQPREATRELLQAAGNTPEARINARAALWEAVKTKKLPAQGSTGNDRWDGKKLKAMFDDPKTSAVADELWSDNPEDLTNIKKVFNALAGAEGSLRTRQPNTSGTAQALSGKFDPSLTAGSIASRVRSVNRGVLSAHVAIIDGVATWLRGRTKQVQARAIDTLASSVVNNPNLAADLLEKYNPADFAAKRRMITQKYGVRATQVLNLIDEANGSDETVDAIKGDQ